VKLPDVNVLIFAMNTDAPEHIRARRWLVDALSGSSVVAFAWVALLGFARISSRLPEPFSVTEVCDTIEGWIAHPNAELVQPTRRHPHVLCSLLEEAGTAGILTTDAHLVAVAIEHGATLASFDADFHRFAGLRFEYLR
jgi:toxin-antitoxin system PIN domain toxin